ncbi:MAG: NAD(P)-dependent dehydrogenase (short-subunit alcohol dehydrogenase family) [Gammaproteobacteria bacterium]|jgi:NAD(P)-dependent dehydrogenase (short-subunit alcohol dehydrogenase family)
MTKEKKVLILGATGGVGEFTAKMLMDKGYYVIANFRKPEQKKKLENAGLCDLAVKLDLADIASIEQAFVEIKGAGISELDGIINCAAIQVAKPLEEVSMDEVQRIFTTNVFGTLRVVQLCIPMLRPRKGRVVLCGSLAGSFVMPLTGIYSASKYALEAVCDALRRELFPWGIDVALIKPGSIDTRMLHDHIENMKASAAKSAIDGSLYAPQYEAQVRQIPKTQSKLMGVLPEEVARICLEALTVKTPKARYYPSFESKAIRFFAPILPDKILDKLSEKVFFPLE